MKPIKVVQVGTAHDHAPSAYRVLTEYTDDFMFAGICEPDGSFPAPLYTGARVFTLEEALHLPDLSAAVIESDELTATEYARRFAEKGVAVYMDKPGSPDYHGFRALIDTVKRKSIPFHMGYMYRYNPEVRRLLDMAARGELGEIFAIGADMSVRHPKDKRAWLSRFPGGMLYFLGCHLIDLSVRLCGEPQEVIPMSYATGVDGVNAMDCGMAILRYPRAAATVRSCAAAYDGYSRRHITVEGSRGTFEIRPLEEYVKDDPQGRIAARSRVTREEDAPDLWSDCARVTVTPPFLRYAEMLCSFAREVRGETVNPYTPDYELTVFRTLLRACGMQA